jgi:hypothetical protein
VGVEANAAHHTLRLRPIVPRQLGTVSVTGLPLFGERIGLQAAGENVVATGLPAGITLNSSTPNRFGVSEGELSW